MDNIRDYIVVIKNALSEKLCNEILNEYKNSDEWNDATIEKGNIDKLQRNCQSISLSSFYTIEKNKEIRKKIDNDIFESSSKCIKEYNNKFIYSKIQQDSGYDLLRYFTGNFYNEHIDSFKDNPRSVSCSFILNNDFEGGEFSFFNKKLKIKLNKGDALMFPSNFMYPHEILPVTNGIRYSIITWFI